MADPEYGSVEAPSCRGCDARQQGCAGCVQDTLAWPARLSFVSTFLLLTLPVWLYTAVTDLLCGCCRTSDESRRRRGRFIGWLTSLLWRIAFRLCCWIRIETDGLQAMSSAGQSGRRVFIAANHASWLDTPIVCACMPAHLVGDTKTLMARTHLGLPVLGRLAHAIGHMPVPFTSNERGNMSVDKERLAATMEKVKAHLNTGGHLAIFPEGDLNSEWGALLPFRAGGIEISISFDMEVWGWVIAGTASCWPRSSACGGAPAVIKNKAMLIYPSARDAAQRLAGADADLRTQAVALANDLRSKMQRSLDELRM